MPGRIFILSLIVQFSMNSMIDALDVPIGAINEAFAPVHWKVDIVTVSWALQGMIVRKVCRLPLSIHR